MNAQKTRKRALAVAGNGIGPRRHALYREAFSRISNAIRDGYFLEAITLTESLLADRLESRATFLLKCEFSFKTLEKLIDKLETEEPDKDLCKLIKDNVAAWKVQRNTALHEIAKIEDGDTRSWDERMVELKGTASLGLSILRKVNSQMSMLRRKSVRPAA